MAVLLVLGFLADGPVTASARPLHHSRLAEGINHSIRLLGTGYVQPVVALLLIAVGAVASQRLKRAGAWTLLAFAVSGAAVNVLKVLVHRPRPWTTEPPPATWVGYLRDSQYQAFPSAETATTFAVAMMIAAWYPSLRLPLVVIAVLVGVARVVVGSHHPSDVIAAAMLGIAVAQALVWVARRKEAGSGAG
ncbi:MAG: phosphatase PAP2 family protein [Armatimonadota bacterium]